MARVTVEDCIDKVQNRFELVLLASERAKSINSGVKLTLDRDNDKDPVVALREIASLNINVDDIREAIVRKLQTKKKWDVSNSDSLDSLGDEDLDDNFCYEMASEGFFDDFSSSDLESETSEGDDSDFEQKD